jgi:hypothetical protein
VYAISILGLNSTSGLGTHTRQIGWAGGADAYYLTPNATGNIVNYQQGIATTLGQTLTADGSNKPIVNNGTTLGLNASGQLIFINVQSLISLPTLPSAYYPVGSVIQYSNAVYQNQAGTWKSVQDPQQILNGALQSGVTLAANQVTAGNFSGCTMTLNANGITTKVNNAIGALGAYLGFLCTRNSSSAFSGITPEQIAFANGTPTPLSVLGATGTGGQLSLSSSSYGSGATAALVAEGGSGWGGALTLIGPSSAQFGIDLSSAIVAGSAGASAGYLIVNINGTARKIQFLAY